MMQNVSDKILHEPRACSQNLIEVRIRVTNAPTTGGRTDGRGGKGPRFWTTAERESSPLNFNFFGRPHSFIMSASRFPPPSHATHVMPHLQ